MRSTTIFTLLGPLSAIVRAQTTVPASTSQTIVPFSSLPACAQKCGPLFDAQGACGQTAATLTAQSPSCFCSYTTLVPFQSGTSGVCSAASGCSASDLTSIRSWYTSYCAANNANAATSSTPTTAGSASTAASDPVAATTTAAVQTAAPASRSWISSHYGYVIMIVLICVFLAALWIVGCIYRKRHLRRRDGLYEMGGTGQANPLSWGPNSSHDLNTANRSQMNMSRSPSSLSFFGGVPQDNASFYMPAPAATKGKSPLSREIDAETGGIHEKRSSGSRLPNFWSSRR